jgi:tRNA(Ile)-lysidine synthase
MGPDPAVAAVRLNLRRSLTDLAGQAGEAHLTDPGGVGQPARALGAAGLADPPLVLAACSGGPDSLAMAAALAFEAPRLGLRAGAVTVDHGLQPGSAEQAARVVATLRGLGLEPVHSLRAEVAGRGGSRYPGPEAAAREARYAAIDAAAVECGATAVMLGHTMDDQAETVLLGLARGSGGRSLAGMQAVSGRYLRPLLGLRRAQTRAACSALGLQPWEDPQNADPAFARTRVRERILPLMEELLGPGITEALARTADRLRADAEALDWMADDAAERLASRDEVLEVAALAALPDAVRTRLLKRAAITAGVPAGSLSSSHIAQVDALVTAWHGQRWSDLPGGIRCLRRYGRLHFTARS